MTIINRVILCIALSTVLVSGMLSAGLSIPYVVLLVLLWLLPFVARLQEIWRERRVPEAEFASADTGPKAAADAGSRQGTGTDWNRLPQSEEAQPTTYADDPITGEMVVTHANTSSEGVVDLPAGTVESLRTTPAERDQGTVEAVGAGTGEMVKATIDDSSPDPYHGVIEGKKPNLRVIPRESHG